MESRRFRWYCVLLMSIGLPLPATGQGLPTAVPADTILLFGEEHLIASGGVGLWMEGPGDRVVVWIDSDVRVGERSGGLPVPDADVGEVVARFASSGAFAWPRRPTVWTAPNSGLLRFGLNAFPQHRLEGHARLLVARLGRDGSGTQAAFDPPLVGVERVDQGIHVRYTDRAGFGLDTRSLAFTVTTARGTVYHLAAWRPAGPREAILPLPPPGIPLPPGIHELSVTVADRMGNTARPATITFDTP